MECTDEQFATLIAKAMDELPQQYIANMDNVAVVYADNPTREQPQKQGVRHGQLLLGLYEGIPLTARYSSGYSGVLPDKITLFKQPLLMISRDQHDFYEHIKRTLWHEIAHHYGLNHADIHERESHSEA